MDPVQSLAILSLGAFVTVLITAIFYVVTVRPHLLEPATPAPAFDDSLYTDLAEQRAVIEHLDRALTQHARQLQVSAAPTEQYYALQAMLQSQTDTLDTLATLLDQQVARLGGVDDRLSQQSEKFTEVAAEVNRQGTRLDRIETRLDTLHLTPLIEAQTDKLASLGARLDEWASTRTAGESGLAEHAHTLADLNREMVSQTQVLQQIETRLEEHTGMLVSTVTEQRAQAGILDRAVSLLAKIFELVERFTTHPARPTQDRLTDIKGIGPVYAGKLYEGGIQSFRQLAALTPDEVLTLLSLPNWRAKGLDVTSWIEQAGHFASQREKAESDL